MNSILNWFLMILPFALWGTSMAAMTPLVSSAGPEFVASLRLLPAGILVLITTYLFKRDLKIYKCDLKWFFVFTIVDATFFQLFLTYGIEKTGAGLGSVLIDSQPLLVAAMALGTILIRFTCTKSDPVAVTGWHMVLGSLPLIIKHCLQSNFTIIPDWSIFDWGLMSFASIFGGAIAYGLFFYFANNKEITGFSTLAFLTPVFALLSGGVWLDERLTIVQWIGVVFVLISVFFVSQRKSLWENKFSDTTI